LPRYHLYVYISYKYSFIQLSRPGWLKGLSVAHFILKHGQQ